LSDAPLQTPEIKYLPNGSEVIKANYRVIGTARSCKDLVGTVVEVQLVGGKKKFKVQWDNGGEFIFFLNSIALLNPPAGGAVPAAVAIVPAHAGGQGAQGHVAARGHEIEEQSDQHDEQKDQDGDHSEDEIDRYD
jgi:hypothetical protein